MFSLQQIGKTKDSVHGCSDFVAHIGHKIFLDDACFTYSLFGFIQLFVELLLTSDTFGDVSKSKYGCQYCGNRHNKPPLPGSLATLIRIKSQSDRKSTRLN